MKTTKTTAAALATALLLVFAPPCSAAFILNGGFEAGLSFWTRADQLGSDGSFVLQTGTASPVNGLPVPPPPEGTTAAMTDAQGPGSHVLYQDFTVTAPVAPGTLLGFELFIGNRATSFETPDTLDFSTPTLDQQARVDIVTTTSDPFSLAPADVLLNLFQTHVGDPLVSGYSAHATDVTAFLNSNLNIPLRLRFAETDNVNIFNFGVDNVSLGAAATVPEPAPWMLVIGALPLLAARRGYRRAWMAGTRFA